MDSPPQETTVTRLPGPNGEGQMDVDPEARRRMRGKTYLSVLNDQRLPVNASTDTTRQEAEGDRDDKRRRVDEPESPVSTVAQDGDVPLPEEPAGVCGENDQGWITEEAFFTVSPGARQVRQRAGRVVRSSGRRAKARLIIKGLLTLTSLTSSHIFRRLPVRAL